MIGTLAGGFGVHTVSGGRLQASGHRGTRCRAGTMIRLRGVA